MDSPKLRVSIVDYTNARPLAWGFLSGVLSYDFETRLDTPAECAAALAAGTADIGLIPSIEYARIPDLRIIPNLAISARREVRSVLLFAKVPLAQLGLPGAIQSVAVDSGSRTSVALLRLVLAERFDITPHFVPTPPALANMLAEHDAALVIGDIALASEVRGCTVVDLASEWYAMTGLPFVFAFWAVRTEVTAAGLESDFTLSLRRGRRALPDIAALAAAELGIAAPLVLDYLTNVLDYGLGEAARAGLHEFYRRAAAAGLIAQAPPLRFYGDDTSIAG